MPSMLRDLLNSVPLTLIMVVAVGLTLGLVVLAVWLARRVVSATRDGFHAEISAPMRPAGSRAVGAP